MRDVLRLLRYARPYLGRLAMALICAALSAMVLLALLSLVPPLINEALPGTQPAADRAAPKASVLHVADRLLGGKDWITRHSDWARQLVERGGNATVFSVAVLVLVLYAFKGVVTYFSAFYVRAVGLQIILDLRTELYARIQRQSLAFFSENPSGLLIARLVYDVARMQRTVSGDLADIFRLSCLVVGQVSWVFYLNWKLSTVCLILLPMIVYPVLRFGRRLKSTSRHTSEKMADATSVMKETFAATRVVKGFGMEAYEVRRFTDALRRLQRQELRAARLVSLSPPLMELVGALGAALLIVYAGFHISRGTLDPGEFTSFLLALGFLYASVKNLAKINNDFQLAMAATQRIFEMLDAPVDVRDRPGARPLPPFRTEIGFREVEFAYGEKPVLRGVNLRVRAGQVVALVGGSGAGKTTLANLIPRFYDVTGGSITIDGVDIRDVTLESLRSQIGIVTQEILLFDDTVRANIAYGRSDIPGEEVERAARAAYAHEFILRLPKGYDTRLGEAGHLISVGERQRISIARALLKNPPILILDEATSALDSESEAMVQRALQNLMAGRTVVVIAHRLSTIRDADLIVVLEDGRVVEQGRHESLLAGRGAYARLYDLQFRGSASASG